MGLFRRKEKDRFGEILIEKGLATRGVVEEALKIQKDIRETSRVYKAIGAILTEKGVIGPEDIDVVIQEQKKRDGFIIKWWIYSIFHSMQPK